VRPGGGIGASRGANATATLTAATDAAIVIHMAFRPTFSFLVL
jgi:hypothetical protein